MNTTISNAIYITDADSNIINYITENLFIDNPNYLVALRLGKNVKYLDKQLALFYQKGDTYVLPFGCLSKIWNFIKFNYKLDFHSFHANNLKGSINLFDYQRCALNSLKSGKNGILEAPCGSGKTQIGLQLIKELKGRALWLTHTHKLLEQSKERCEQYFTGDFGTITEGKINIGKDITFATIQTIANIDPSIYRNEFDIIIVDECHHCVGSPSKMMQFYKVVSNCNARYKFGLSATLNRTDGLDKSMYSIIGEKLHTITEDEVTKAGRRMVADYKAIKIDIDYDIFDYLNADGTINYANMINMLSSSKERDKIIIDNIINNLPRKQLILCHRVAQVKELYDKLKDVDCTFLIGSIKQKNRSYDNKVIIATYSIAKEGLDIPDLEILHLATPQKDYATTIQAVGRIERVAQNKQTPIVYDYIDSNIDYCVRCYKKRVNILKKRK